MWVVKIGTCGLGFFHNCNFSLLKQAQNESTTDIWKKRTSQPFLRGRTISSLCMHAISLTGKEIRMEIHTKVCRILHRWKSVLVLYQLLKGTGFQPSSWVQEAGRDEGQPGSKTGMRWQWTEGGNNCFYVLLLQPFEYCQTWKWRRKCVLPCWNLVSVQQFGSEFRGRMLLGFSKLSWIWLQYYRIVVILTYICSVIWVK